MHPLAEIAASVLIGDGVVAMLIPERHTRRWIRGPRPWRAAMAFLAARPHLKRALSAAQIALGLGVALRRAGGER